MKLPYRIERILNDAARARQAQIKGIVYHYVTHELSFRLSAIRAGPRHYCVPRQYEAVLEVPVSKAEHRH